MHTDDRERQTEKKDIEYDSVKQLNYTKMIITEDQLWTYLAKIAITRNVSFIAFSAATAPTLNQLWGRYC